MLTRVGSIVCAYVVLVACSPAYPDERTDDISAPITLAAPTLVAPKGPGIVPSPTFRFDPVSGATRYRLWVNDKNGVRLDQTWDADTACPSGTGCEITPTITLSSGPCTWWMQARSDIAVSSWSSASVFTVGGPPPAPILTAPGPLANTTPTYAWIGASADEYAVWVNDANGVRVNQAFSAAQVGCTSGGACSTTPATPLVPGPARFWVQARNASGASPWSAALAFSVTNSVPSVPLPAQVTSVVFNNTPTFRWERSPLATHYDLWVDDRTGTRLQAAYTAAEAGCETAPICAVTPSTPLNRGKVTYWVRARNSAGRSGWSNAQEFFVEASLESEWLAYIAERVSGTRELWIAKVLAGAPTSPLRVNAALSADQHVEWFSWSPSGKHLVYRTSASRLFIVDVGRLEPGTPVPLPPFATDPISNQPQWSPDGNYLAYEGVNPANSQRTIVVADSTKSPATVAYATRESTDPWSSEHLSWSGDSTHIYVQVGHSAIWSTAVTSSGLQAMRLMVQAFSNVEVVGTFHASPVGRAIALTIRSTRTGFTRMFRFDDVPVFPIGLDEPTNNGFYSRFVDWLPMGELVYWANSSPDNLQVGSCGNVMYDIPGATGVRYRPSPSGRLLAIEMIEAGAPSPALYFRPNTIGGGCLDPSVKALPEVPATYVWLSGSNGIAFVNGSIHVMYTRFMSMSPIPHVELTGSVPAGTSVDTLASAASRLFYTTTDSHALRYIDLRNDEVAPASVIVTPNFGHAAVSPTEWAVSDQGRYVTMKGDYAADGTFELYFSDLGGEGPSAARRLDFPYATPQHVEAFSWQPVPPGSPPLP